MTILGIPVTATWSDHFTAGGPVTINGQSVDAAADWGVVYQSGTQPTYAGQWDAPGQALTPANLALVL